MNRQKSDLLKPSTVVIFFFLSCPLKDPELHHAMVAAGCMVAPAFTSPNKSSLFVHVRSSRASVLVDSLITCVRTLLSMYSRNLLDCLCPAVLHSSRHWSGSRPPGQSESANMRFFQDESEEGLVYFLLDQIVCSRQP